MIIEYVPFGDLLGHLRKSRGLIDTYFDDPDIKPTSSLTSKQLFSYASQIANGMVYLSSRKVGFIPHRIIRCAGISLAQCVAFLKL